MLVYTNGDTELDHIAKPENIIERLPHYKGIFESLGEMQHQTDMLAAEQGHEKVKGYHHGDTKAGLKVIARIPEKQLIAFMAVEPDLLQDEKVFNKFLKKHPIYRAYTNATV